MKKIIAITLLIIALCGSATADLYPETARVLNIDYVENLVVVETFNGFMFAFEGCEDYAKGDCVSLIMNDKGTEEIFDDEIIMAQYCGWELIN